MKSISQELNTKFPNKHVEAFINLLYTSSMIDNQINAMLKPFDISHPQYNVLRILRGAKEKLTAQTIKDRMVDKSPNLTRLVDKLLKKNLVSRTRCDEDRRVVWIEISKEGLVFLQRIDQHLEDEMKYSVTVLEEEEAAQLSVLIDKMRNKLLERES